MTTAGIADELAAVSSRLAGEPDLAPEDVRRLVRRRGELIALLAVSGAAEGAEEVLAAAYRHGEQAGRRLAVYRDSLLRQLDSLGREQRLLGQIKKNLPRARARLDLQA